VRRNGIDILIFKYANIHKPRSTQRKVMEATKVGIREFRVGMSKKSIALDALCGQKMPTSLVLA
jgi:hypothetical protein